MKKMQKVLAVLMIMVLALTLVPMTAFAANEGSITINNAEKGQTYSIYQMATIESSTGTDADDKYSYKVADGWAAFFTAQGIPVIDGYVRYSDSDSMSATEAIAFAKAAVAYAKENSIAATKTAVADDTKTVSFTDLALGYYCIDSTVGTVCALTNANPNATLSEKNNIPVIGKFVKEDSNDTYSASNDDTIGETVYFKSEVKVTNGAVNYVITDTMSKGLTLNPDSITVTYIDSNVTATNKVITLTPEVLILGTDTDRDTELEKLFGADKWEDYKECDFVLKMKNEDLVTIPTGQNFTISYTATINEDAEIGTNGNPNETQLIYGDNLDIFTEKSTTKTYVWGTGVYKYTGTTTKTPLAGAEFQLKNSAEANAAAMKFVVVDGAEVPTYRHVHGGDEANMVDTITTDANGKFKIVGLDSGNYYLYETKAPAGYNKLTAPVTVQVVKVGSYDEVGLNYRVEGEVDGYIEVINHTGVILPETGSTGTVIFVTVGSILVIGMGLLLVAKKRMSKIEFVK